MWVFTTIAQHFLSSKQIHLEARIAWNPVYNIDIDLDFKSSQNWSGTRDYCEVSVRHSSGTGGAENEVVSSLANSIFKLSAKSCRDASEIKSRLICWQNMLQFLRIYLQILVTHSKYYPICALFLHSLKFLKTKVEAPESLKYICSSVCLSVCLPHLRSEY